ncbi:phosphotransferase [Arenicella xantha]|uniref:Aminoglycoside phosphotransferase (APT) family kinase protein n=1 Tax=Arenicella xantha TaxID=644221 RepID=A0A395JL13_9GAMM|nr:phosphotransferase [Arenicella xantha]RBP49732.1 aminoglycoside phosphotransferase (APT) family kinase protein [Arenicella xantha]
MHDLNIDNLSNYLKQYVDGFELPLEVEKFPGGQSNPTFKLSTPNAQYVLRRKPPGQLLKGAHAVDREFRMLTALQSSAVPVATPIALCEDDAVIGSMFYVMEYLDGRILWDPVLPDSDAQERRAIYTEMNRVLSALHMVNIDAVGLSDFGKHSDYFARQTHTWTKQYRASEMDPIPAVDSLIEWLPANMPADDGLVSIVHGDYRLDNLMFHRSEPQAIAVLDWELSTIGHPYADLAYQCMQYHIPHGKGLPGLRGADLEQLGIPTEQEYIAMYCERTGVTSIPNWNFYLAFSLFRLAAICQGVAKRAQQGNASSNNAANYGELVEPLASIALDLTQ